MSTILRMFLCVCVTSNLNLSFRVKWRSIYVFSFVNGLGWFIECPRPLPLEDRALRISGCLSGVVDGNDNRLVVAPDPKAGINQVLIRVRC